MVLAVQSTVDTVLMSKTLSGLTLMTVGTRLISTLAFTSRVILDLRNASGVLLNLFVNASGLVEVRRGTTVLGTSTTAVLGANTESYVELCVLFDGTSGAFVLQVNGAEEASASAVNTADVAVGTGCTRLDLMGANSTTGHFGYTDLYVRERADIEVPGFLGPIIGHLINPTSDISVDWTPDSGADNYARVQTPAATGSYIDSDTVDEVDEYGLASLPAGVNNVLAVSRVSVSEAPDGGAPQISHGIKRGATEKYGAGLTVGVGGVLTQMTHFDTQPDDSSWSVAAVNELVSLLKAV